MMNVVWKRPDGYHGASPADYELVPFEGSALKIWLHKKDSQNFPFRVSGGWEDEVATHRLNHLVNLFPKDKRAFKADLENLFHHSEFEQFSEYLSHIGDWLSGLKSCLKGDSWEIAIMLETIELLQKRLDGLKGES